MKTYSHRILRLNQEESLDALAHRLNVEGEAGFGVVAVVGDLVILRRENN